MKESYRERCSEPLWPRVMRRRSRGRSRSVDRGKSRQGIELRNQLRPGGRRCFVKRKVTTTDRKSTRLNSSHGYISYAVFCLKKKKKQKKEHNSISYRLLR